MQSRGCFWCLMSITFPRIISFNTDKPQPNKLPRSVQISATAGIYVERVKPWHGQCTNVYEAQNFSRLTVYHTDHQLNFRRMSLTQAQRRAVRSKLFYDLAFTTQIRFEGQKNLVKRTTTELRLSPHVRIPHEDNLGFMVSNRL